MAYRHLFLPVSACFALGLATISCSGGPDSAEEPVATQQVGTELPPQSNVRATPALQVSSPAARAGIAQTTLRLEKEFADQFVRGAIDPAALQPAIDDVVQAMPEAARDKVQQHIALVLENGTKLAARMTPEQRADLAKSPPAGALDKVQVAILAAYGWPGAVGFGGIGAFGFPGMYGYAAYGYPGVYGGYAIGPYGYGYSTGFATGYSTFSSFSSATSTSSAYGCGFGFGCYGLGGVGWGW